MSVADLIEAMSAEGAPMSAILLAVRAIEAMEAKDEARRAQNRERKQRERAKSRDSHATVTPPVTPKGSETKGSPTPLPKTQPPNSPPSPLTGAHGSVTVEFDEFWLAYPRKVGKGACRAKFLTARRKMDFGGIMAGLAKAKDRWRDIEPQFVPHPATWLGQERWLDEPETKETGPPSVVAVVDEDFIARQKARIAEYARQQAASNGSDHAPQ